MLMRDGQPHCLVGDLSASDEAEEQGGGGKEDFEGAETRLCCPGSDGVQPHPDV